MNSLVYEGRPGSVHPVVPPAQIEKRSEGTFKLGDFEFSKAKEDTKSGTISVASLLNIMLTALASSNDPAIKDVLDKAGLTLQDVNGKTYFPR